MRLSKQTSDAVKILVHCARMRDDLVKVAEVAEQTQVTKALGLKLVNLLSRFGYVETVRGPKGGIRLSCNPAETRLGNIVRDLEVFGMAPVVSEGVPASDLPSALEGCVDDAFEAFVSVLNQNTLSDLAAAGAPIGLTSGTAGEPKARGSRRRKPKSGSRMGAAAEGGAA